MRRSQRRPEAAQAPPSQGGDNGLDVLYRRYADWLTAMLRRRFGASIGDTADDLVQETYVRIAPYEAAGQIRRPQALLMRVASNLARDHLRRNNVRGVQVEFSGEDSVEDAERIDADQVEALLFKQIVLTMPPAYRDVFVLSRIAGLTYEEIAAHSGLSIKTVEWRMSRALAHCAARVQD
ncbi:MAG: RNA polymerase sigma factor [Phenylobacterium sp.]|uniref:RNA polymerase sigma factor n=1 Tax=Phenylobacterium sp. TaxID=1871053 RepID=UPI0027360DD0|nr:RNA polymerase sigma factor [Phenylobacterium sp.]MDP3746804.1 RNA polymerase sigma factor [Phenylobacterium sp.]